ncbi:hypothetical protein EW146_g8952 [Bondarzewia mesenterica]|uniref:Methyltransferase domain-containing protein n=1 Tax=Bondarzewia mesenterica TaxID=1095465 RepID=A0A4S4LAJ9_9AGAM|nr:hypothetical protein EW146_g8952 [Bondarzewia mesenterica]
MSVANAEAKQDTQAPFRKLVAEHGWEEAWKKNITPWESHGTAKAQPALRELIESSRLDLPTSGRALVPGCGRGFDAILIASSLGLQTLGTDISSTAIQAANDLLASSPNVQASGKVSFETADFFTMKVPENERFDLVYDYTFFVAIPPSYRKDWGRQMNGLTKPGAYLIALVFPLGLDPEGEGPPHYVEPEHYDELLAGWTKVLDEVPKPTVEKATPLNRMPPEWHLFSRLPVYRSRTVTGMKKNVTPWEEHGTAKAQPALQELIESSRLDLPTSGRALVPGCGRGYDAIYIASSLGLQTLGTDISSTAIQAANDLLASSPDVQASKKVSFEETDFFTMKVTEDERFDLVYDYTFFVAIPPSYRKDWGRQMNALTKPGAYLVTLVFPLGLDPDGEGPPHYVELEHYDELLSGWTKVLDEVPKVSNPTHVGRERIVVWKKNSV